MAKIHFDLNSAGVVELMKMPEWDPVLTAAAERIRGRAASQSGLEYEVKAVHVGRSRKNVTVSVGSAHAYYENLKNNTLLNALEG